MQINRVKNTSYTALALLLVAIFALSGFSGGFLTGTSAANLNPTGTVTKTLGTAGTPGLTTTGTPSASAPTVLIPVTGTTNLVLASQILGYKVVLAQAGSVGTSVTQVSPGSTSGTQTPDVRSTVAATTSPTGTPTVASTLPNRTVTVAPTSSGSMVPTTSPSSGGAASTQPSSTTTPGGLVGSTGLDEEPLGIVRDIMVLNNVSFMGLPEISPEVTSTPGMIETPSGAEVTATPQATSRVTGTGTPQATLSITGTATPQATLRVTGTAAAQPTMNVTGTPALSITATPGGVSTQAVATPSITQNGTTSKMDGQLENATKGQLVFVIVELSNGTNFNPAGTRNLVAIPWDRMRVMPSENKVIVDAPAANLNSFPFFSQADYTTIGTGSNLQKWFAFWSIPLPRDLAGAAPQNAVTPVPTIVNTSTPAP